MRLWLVRHARPLIEPGVCYGSTDVPADAHSTAAQAARLADLLPADSRVSSSPLQRCGSLALALCRLRPDLAIEWDARLQEMHFGDWEGRFWRDIDAGEFENWMTHFADHRVGGGDSVRAFTTRVALALHAAALCAAAGDEAAARDAVWITHAGVIRAVTWLAQSDSPLVSACQWPKHAPEPGEWCNITLDASAMLRIRKACGGMSL